MGVLELRTAHCVFRMEKHQPHYLPMEKWKVFHCRRTSGYISGLCSKTLPRSYFLNASHLQPATNKSHTGYLLTLHTQVTSSSCRFQASQHKNIHGTSSINNAQREYFNIQYIKDSNVWSLRIWIYILYRNVIMSLSPKFVPILSWSHHQLSDAASFLFHKWSRNSGG